MSQEKVYTPEPEIEAEQERGISWAVLRSMFMRQRWIVLSLLAAGLALGLILSLLATPIYQAVATVQIDPDGAGIVEDGQIEQQLDYANLVTYINTQVQVIQSRTMATRVADQLRLAANNDFLEGMQIETDGLGAQQRRDVVVAALMGNLEVSVDARSNIPAIGFNSPSRTIAVSVANAYAESLITGEIERKYEATAYARDFLAKEIASAKERLEEAERLAIVYAGNNQIIDASDGVAVSDDSSGPRSITTSNLIVANQAYAEARTARIKAEQRWRQASGSNVLDVPDVQSSPVIQSLLAQRSQREADYRELLGRYRNDHPAAQEANAEIESLNVQINRIGGQIRNAVRAEYETALQQERALSGTVDELKGDTLNEQTDRVQLNLLAREVDTSRAQYQALLERFKEVSTASEVVSTNISILDRAQDAYKVSPDLVLNLITFGMIGLALGAGIAFMREKFDDLVRTPDDVQRKLGLSLLGTTPLVEFGDNVLVPLADRKSQLAEAYASLRSSLDFSTAHGAPRSLLVTSGQPSEGKSTTSLALAESFARAGKRTLLVDTDLRNPSIHRYLDVPNELGFTDVATGNVALAEAVKPGAEDELRAFDLLTCGTQPPNPTEIISAESIGQFLSSVGGAYDVVVLDGPPVMGLADAPQLSRAAEGTLLVVESGRGMGGQTKTAIKRLRFARSRLLGAVLTKFDTRQSGYGEYYGYQYEYSKKRG